MKKRNLFIVLIPALCLTLLAACGQPGSPHPDSPEEGKRLSVVSTIFPGYDFAREVGGDLVSLTMLLQPGAESHSYDPTPQDIIKIQNCDVFIYVGGESDAWVKSILGSMDTSGMQLISMMDLVDVVEEEIVEGMEHGHDHEDGDHGHEDEAEYDEHVWTSPINAMGICNHIAQILSALDEDNTGVYRSNCEAYTAKLQELNVTFREISNSGVRSTLVFGDRFPFRYFADEYGLDYYAAFPGCSTETEASAKTIAFLIDKVKEEEIPAVLYIEFSNQKMANTICEATGARALQLHSCHNVTRDDFLNGVSYLELMGQNIITLKEALG